MSEFSSKLVRQFHNSFNWKMALAGALLLAGIVYFVNLDHGWKPASWAGIKQFAYSFFLGGLLVRFCEKRSMTWETAWTSILWATVSTSVLTLAATYAMHNLKGTPEPAMSTLPTLIAAPLSFLGMAILHRKRKYSAPQKRTAP